MKTAIHTLLATTAIACMTVTTAVAQESETVDRQRVQRRSTDAGNLDEKTRGANIRVSQLMGYNIQNSQGESVGEIKDIVIDSRTGKVKYAAVTYGGFIGLGNKLFAVPFEAFKVQVDPDEIGDDDVDADDYVLVLNVTQQQLEGQEGFDEDNWPDMADRQWARELDKRYGVNRNEDAKERMKRLNRESNNQ
ncbi:photosystem reaction center subunit H [Rhodopirellula sp. SM50]|nr:PRC-barrel domain-containing protein [Rhodopirellula sp. SM50]PAY18857.1 photosystem reaction center subunit H [Rhodopirellula sp. SM50]